MLPLTAPIAATAVVLVHLAAVDATAAISRCTGPAGEVLFTDRECPAGYRLERTFEAAPADSGREAASCESAEQLGPHEIETAVGDAERGLAAAEAARDREAASSWRACLTALRERRAALEAEAGGGPAQPPERQVIVEPFCRTGAFRTENGIRSFEVYFTNQGKLPCAAVTCYCLFHLFTGGPGDYRESETLRYEGLLQPGEEARIGSVSSKGGPPSRSIAWSWCRFR